VPIYEFRCDACGTIFEAIRPLGDDGSHLRCPACETGAVRRIPSTFAAAGGGKSSVSSCGPGGFS
jgi:putative FmdB family regulatory protein